MHASPMFSEERMQPAAPRKGFRVRQLCFVLLFGLIAVFLLARGYEYASALKVPTNARIQELEAAHAQHSAQLASMGYRISRMESTLQGMHESLAALLATKTAEGTSVNAEKSLVTKEKLLEGGDNIIVPSAAHELTDKTADESANPVETQTAGVVQQQTAEPEEKAGEASQATTEIAVQETKERQADKLQNTILLPGGDAIATQPAVGSLEDALKGLARGSAIVVTFADARFEDMLRNFLAHARNSGILNRLVVGAMDDTVASICQREGARCFHMKDNIESFGFGAQVPLLKMLLVQGYHVLMSDVDVVWLKDPFPFFESTPSRKAADVLLSTDCPGHKIFQQGDGWHSSFNIGIMLWRSTNRSITLAEEWLQSLRKEGHVGYMQEQGVLNQLIRGKDSRELWPLRSVDTTPIRDPGAVVWGHVVKFGLLPVAQFAHGHMYFVAKIPQQLNLTVYCVHATYQFGGYAGKRNRFREAGLWLADGDEYYNGKYLTWMAPTRPEGLADSEPLVEQHMTLVKRYFEDLHTAFGLAQALGRLVIIPKLRCYCDTHWTIVTPECRMGYSDLELPFTCPLDHLLDTSRLFNIKIPFRETGFLDNPRSKAVKESMRFIEVASTPAHLDGGQEKGNVQWPRIMNDVQAAEFVKTAGLDDARVLQFGSMNNAFCGFEDNQIDATYKDRMRQLFSGSWWCCEQDPTVKEYKGRPREFATPANLQCKAQRRLWQ
eukprot:jgi/Chlat1/4271/Chrsp29S04552